METMASAGGRPNSTVAAQLYRSGHRFDFYQAVRLLELLHPEAAAPGATLTPAQEVVRFRSAVDFAFAATEVASVDYGARLCALASAAQADLDRNTLPAALVEALAEQGIALAPATTVVTPMQPGAHWQIVNAAQRHTFWIEQEETPQGRHLAVYSGQRAIMEVNFLGLAGVLGPLPAPYTKLLLERLRAGDPILRDFLDLFTHRLVALLYQVRKRRRIGFAPQAPGEDGFARQLFALIGLEGPGLRQRMAVEDGALLRYVGLLAPATRSAAGLERLLGDYFQVAVQVRQFVGAWLRLEAEDWTAIGQRGRNQALGQGFLLGQRVYDGGSRVAVHLGPLSFQQFLDFLPIGSGFRALCALVQFYGRDALPFDLHLTLQAAEAPGFRLGSKSTRLRWTTWLKTHEVGVGERLVKLESCGR